MPGCAPKAKNYHRLNVKRSKDGKFHMGLNDSNLVVVPGRAAQDGIHLWDEVVEVNGVELEEQDKLAEVLKKHEKEWSDKDQYEFVIRRRKEKELPEGHPDISEEDLAKVEGAPGPAKEKKKEKTKEKTKSKKGKDEDRARTTRRRRTARRTGRGRRTTRRTVRRRGRARRGAGTRSRGRRRRASSRRRTRGLAAPSSLRRTPSSPRASARRTSTSTRPRSR